MRLKTISVRQPYAEAILRQAKVEEYRSWPTTFRGLLALHASLTREPAECWSAYAEIDRATVATGAVVGTVVITDCEAFEYEGEGTRYAWLLAEPRRLVRPLPCKGKVGFFYVDVPDDLLRLSGVK